MIVVKTPQVVQNAVENFIGRHFRNTSQRKHATNYLTGLLVGDNKTIAGMSDRFLNASDQSCMNRFMTEVDWDPQALNQSRIEYMQQCEDTKFHKDGVIALDDTIIPKTGKHIKDIGKLYDHANQRYVYGHDLLFIDYVHPTSGKHYPIDFRRYTPCT
jgi:hypothetical protein